MNLSICQDVFDLLEACPTFSRERHEVRSASFDQLRLGVRYLILSLREAEDEWVQEQVLQLQRMLADWLTAPCSLTGEAADALLEVLGNIEGIGGLGEEAVQSLHLALEGASALVGQKSLLQQTTGALITHLASTNVDFKILCHRSVRKHFADCLDPTSSPILDEQTFLHSVRDYRDSPVFDVLIKVGPLKSEGWGAVPPAVLNAPRYRRLVQIVWSGTTDDARSGLDPILSQPTGSQAVVSNNFAGGISWNLKVFAIGDGSEPQQEVHNVDDLGLLQPSDLAGFDMRRQAVIVHVPRNRGVPYPLNATVLVFDPLAAQAEAFREVSVSDELRPGMFLIWPRLNDLDSKGIAWHGGKFHPTWKEKLAEQLALNSVELERRLRRAGLNLASLDAAMRHWARPPTTVIHAPQRKRHFEILIKVLAVQSLAGDRRSMGAAWQEVRRSRGEAIQAGVQEHARVMEMGISILHSLRSEAESEATRIDEFAVYAPRESSAFGDFLFMKVEGVEDGYRVPESELRQIQSLEEVVVWRV
jgi:hypothetical protein